MSTEPKSVGQAGCRPLSQTNSFVDLQILDGGSFTANESRIVAGAEDYEFCVPDWAFMIRDHDSGRSLLWDYGLSSDAAEFTPFVKQNLFAELRPVSPPKSIPQQILERCCLAPQDLDTIIFSHAHWDHCRPFWKDFSRATAFFGPRTIESCQPGHLKSPASQWDGRIFDDPVGLQKCRELTGPWVPFGSFDHAMDFFGNGSFWVIQAPGHMAGNLIAAARCRSGTWIIVAGDCCHARRIYEGQGDFAVFSLPGGQSISLQSDIPAARDTLRRIKAFERTYSAKICLAHDASWMSKGSEDELLISLLSEEVKEAFQRRLPKAERS